MSSRSVRSRVVGALSIAYGVLLGLFWAWVLTQGKEEWGGGALLIVLFVAVSVLLVVTGYGLCSARVPGPDARALKAATVVVLAVKVAVVGYWAVGHILATGPFSGLRHFVGWRAVWVEVVPSGVWAVVLALTSVPTDDPPSPREQVSEESPS